MYDPDAIEAINFEQIATVTDRLLLRGGRMTKRRPNTNRISTNRILVAPLQPVAAPELTYVVRRRKRTLDTTVFALGSAIVGVMVAIVALL